MKTQERHNDRGPILRSELLQAGYRRLEIVMDQEGQPTGNGQAVLDSLLVGVGPAKQVQVGHAGLEVPFLGGQLAGLIPGDHLGVEVPGHRHQHAAQGAEKQGDGERAPGKLLVPVAQEIVSRDAHDEEAPRMKAARRACRRRIDGGGVEDHGPEIGDFGPAVLRDEKPAGVCCQELAMMIHTAENMRAQGDHERGDEVHPRRHAVPAEDQHGQETGLEEEGKDALGGQGRAEDVADEAGVAGPVGAELELHHDAGGHAHREIDREQPRPEPRHGVITPIAGA